MCGVAGIFSNDKNSAFDSASILASIAHRGPDGRGAFSDAGLILGHTRLSIIDLNERANQPMVSPCERYCLVFNGEIYNYLELRQELAALGKDFKTQSDTEVLLHCLIEWGDAALLKLRGVFAFALWDKQTEQLWLARDRFGEKPLYYTQDGDRFIFSSELKSIAKMSRRKTELCPIGLNLFMHYQFVHEPNTILRDVYKLERAHSMRVTKGQVTDIAQYWSFADVRPVEGEPAKIVRDHLEIAMERQLRSDAKLGVALSAGIDSSILLAMTAKHRSEPVDCYSVGYPGHPPFDERREAEQFAKKFGANFFDIELDTEHFEEFFPELVSAMDDPIADIAAFGHFSVAHLASQKGAKVMMSGLGGDELFWGYAWPPQAVALTEQYRAGTLRRSPLASRFKWMLNNRLTRRFVSPALATLMTNPAADLPNKDHAIFYNIAPDFMDSRNFNRTALQDVAAADFDLPFDKFKMPADEPVHVPNFINQCLFDGWLVGNCLALTDRVSMYSGVEARVPFLDHDLVDAVFGLRHTHRDVEGENKLWLKQAVQDFIPAEVLNRPKKGFTPPVADWMTRIIGKYKDEILAASPLHNYFDMQIVKALFDKAQNLQIAYKIVLLHIWIKQVDG